MKKTILTIVLAMLCLIFSLQSQDQDTITGTIYTQDRKPLAGVTIKIMDTEISTTTDENGKFSLVSKTKKGILTFSYTGYETQSMDYIMGREDKFKIFMREKQSQLREVEINTGYYTVKERERTGSISKVAAETIEKQPVSNPLQALQGRVPGVEIIQQTGVPGGGFKVQIRGQNSISSGNDPLYIIDGVNYPSTRINNENSNTIIQDASPLSLINPNDIESIEVLKDADATAIYGSRGANGVILITTKKGNAGNTRINAAVSQGFSTVGNKLDLMNTQQYLAMRLEAFKNSGTTPSSADYDLNGIWDKNKYTDWQEKLIGGTADVTNAALSITGGSPQISYLFGGNYYSEGTVFPGSFGFKRGGIHSTMNLGSENSRLKASINLNYSQTINNLLSADPTQNILLAPNAPDAYDQSGNLNWTYNNTPIYLNPMAGLLNTIRANTDNLLGNVTLNYRITSGLVLKTSAGYTSIKRDELAKRPLAAMSPAFEPSTSSRTTQFGNNYQNSWIIEPQLDYRYVLGKGELNALIGMSFQDNTSEYRNIQASNFSSDELMDNISSASVLSVTESRYSKYRYTAVFSRLNYSLMDRYFLNLTARRDGSSRFGPNKQFANFGAIGAAWVFSDEQFFKNHFPFLSFGKLRASYGITGNDQIPDYQFMQLFDTGLSYQGTPTLVTGRIANPDFAWETNRKAEIALQLSFLDEKINVQAAFFRNRSSNQLAYLPLPPSVGGRGSLYANLPATVQNTGLEIDFSIKTLNGANWSWSTGFNLSLPKNKLLNYPDLASSGNAAVMIVGQPLAIRRYYKTNIDPQTGLYVFEDKNNNGVKDDADLSESKFIGQIFYGGVQNTIRYKNLNLDFLISFTKQNGNSYLYGLTYAPGYFVNSSPTSNQPNAVSNRWQHTGDITEVPKFTSSSAGNTNFRLGKRDGSQSVDDASFVRLKNVSLSYNLPKHWISKLHIRELKLEILGQNLITLTKYEGLDPENQIFSRLPPLRTLMLGLKLTL